MQHPDEGVIHTWLDGELSAEEAAALEMHIAECADCAAAVAEVRGLIAGSSRIVSALDIVPGDVIPAAAPRKHAWYANTQLRAAAAVIVVAGASLIVMREERIPEAHQVMDRTVSADTSSSVAEAESPRSSLEQKSGTARRNASAPLMTKPDETRAQGNVAAPAPVKPGTARRAEARPKQEIDARDEVAATSESINQAMDAARSKESERAVLSGKVAGVQAPAPPAMAVAPSPGLQRRLSALRDSNAQLNAVVVTGVATARSAEIGAVSEEVMREVKLREVKSDTTGSVVTTTYALSPNVQVRLTETTPTFAAQSGNTDQARKEKSVIADSSVTVVPAVPPSRTVKIESITWTNPSTGRVYTLSGPLSKEQLTMLRKRLPSDKR